MRICVLICVLLSYAENHVTIIPMGPQKKDTEEIVRDWASPNEKPENIGSAEVNDLIPSLIDGQCSLELNGLFQAYCILTILSEYVDISGCAYSMQKQCFEYRTKRLNLKTFCYELKKLKYHEVFTNFASCQAALFQYLNVKRKGSPGSFTQRKILSMSQKRKEKQENDKNAEQSQHILRESTKYSTTHSIHVVGMKVKRSRTSVKHTKQSSNRGFITDAGSNNMQSLNSSPEPMTGGVDLHRRSVSVQPELHSVINSSNITLEKLALEEYKEFVALMEQNFSKDPLRAMLSVTFLMVVLLVAIKLCGMKPIKRQSEYAADYKDDEHFVTIREILKMKRPYLPKKLLHWERRFRRKLKRKRKMKKEKEVTEPLISDNSEEESVIYSQSLDF